jgi:hypothetical protein
MDSFLDRDDEYANAFKDSTKESEPFVSLRGFYDWIYNGWLDFKAYFDDLFS